MELNCSARDVVLIGVFLISGASLVYTIISSYAIRGNDLKHIQDSINDMKDRIVRIEDKIFNGGKK